MIESSADKYKFTQEERDKAFEIVNEYLKEKEFKNRNEDGQQKLLAAACGQMIVSGIPEIKAVVFVSNLHGRVSATNGSSIRSIQEILSPNKKGMMG